MESPWVAGRCWEITPTSPHDARSHGSGRAAEGERRRCWGDRIWESGECEFLSSRHVCDVRDPGVVGMRSRTEEPRLVVRTEVFWKQSLVEAPRNERTGLLATARDRTRGHGSPTEARLASRCWEDSLQGTGRLDDRPSSKGFNMFRDQYGSIAMDGWGCSLQVKYCFYIELIAKTPCDCNSQVFREIFQWVFSPSL